MKWLTAFIRGLIEGLFSARREQQEANDVAQTVPDAPKSRIDKLRQLVADKLRKSKTSANEQGRDLQVPPKQ